LLIQVTSDASTPKKEVLRKTDEFFLYNNKTLDEKQKCDYN